MMENQKMQEPQNEIERLFFQMDNMFHTRVNSLLVAETIFFVAAITSLNYFPLLLFISILGIFASLIFTWTNLKLYWRVAWLIKKMIKNSPFYAEYISLKDIEKIDPPWGRFTFWLISFLSPSDGKIQKRCLDTGWLYTWGLFIIALAGWIGIIIFGACKT